MIFDPPCKRNLGLRIKIQQPNITQQKEKQNRNNFLANNISMDIFSHNLILIYLN